MGLQSGIEWTESTWNPVTGCTKISPGCKHCYAERLAKRLKAMGQPNYANGFEVTLHERMLELPLRWRKPQRIFVNSMSDLFHVDVPMEFVHRVFEVMRRAHWHQFQVLTKRAERLLECSSQIAWPSNVWMGVSVENADYTYRIDHLRETGAAVKFLSIEPLLGPLDGLDLRGIDWVIVGGESGPKARPIDAAWVQSIRDQCIASRTPFFFKQWGGTNKKRTGRELEGRTWTSYRSNAQAKTLGGQPSRTMEFRIVLIESEEGFAVSCPALRGCHSQGRTREEAIESIRDAIQELLECENTSPLV